MSFIVLLLLFIGLSGWLDARVDGKTKSERRTTDQAKGGR
jgi:hypothetical protein